MHLEDLKIAILIPCFNEEVTIGKVIEDFRKELPLACIYVFDNNSTDRTAKIAQDKGVVVIKEKRQGKGYVITAMFEKVEADLYVMVDGDDTYPAETVHDLIRPIVEKDVDMTVGTRLTSFTSESFRPFHILGNNLVIGIVNWMFDSDLRDIMSGYRGFNRNIVKNIPLVAKGFEVETQIVIQSLYYNYTIQEVEIDYRERPKGSFSKLNTFSDGVRVLLTIFNIVKAYRPLFFFGLLGILFLMASFGIGMIPVVEFYQTGKINHFPTAILASGLALLSSILFAIGLILDTVNFRIRELMFATRKR